MKKLLLTLTAVTALSIPTLAQADQYNAAQHACQTAPITCKSNAPQVGFKCTMTSGGKTYSLGGNGVAQSTVETQLKQECSVANASK